MTYFPLKGRRKRAWLAASLRVLRHRAGRHLRDRSRRHYRASDWPAMVTREHAWVLWRANRAFNAAARRADRKWYPHDRMVLGTGGQLVQDPEIRPETSPVGLA